MTAHAGEAFITLNRGAVHTTSCSARCRAGFDDHQLDMITCVRLSVTHVRGPHLFI